MKELFLVKGETDGTNKTGTAPLDSDFFYSTATYLRIPKGAKAKIWFKDIAAEAETLFTIQYTYDCTAAAPTWKGVQNEKIAEKGQLSIEKRRPTILRGFTGKEAFRVNWDQPTQAKAYFTLGVELTDVEDDS
jgi:hypothetical protein